MKGKEKCFLIAITLCIFILVILSIILRNPLWGKIEASMSIPVLIVSAVNIAVAVAEQIVYMCELKQTELGGRYELWKYNKEIHEDFLQKFAKGLSPEEIESDECVKNQRTAIQKAETKMRVISGDVLCYDEISRRVKENWGIKGTKILYILSLIVLLLSIILSEMMWEIMSKFFLLIPSSTIVLASLLLILFDLTFREPLSEYILKAMFKKEKIKLEAAQNGQTEDGNP